LTYTITLPTRPPPPTATLFPYTTLFRSHHRRVAEVRRVDRRVAVELRQEGHRRIATQVIGRATDRERLRRKVRRDLIGPVDRLRSEEHTSELQSLRHLVCRLLLEKKK